MSDPIPRLLLVEDDVHIRRFVRLALEAEQMEVHEAPTLRAGLIDAGTRRPDLVVLDLGLPDGDGVAFIRDLRTWSHVPVIVLSARTAEAEKIAALDAPTTTSPSPSAPASCWPACAPSCAAARRAPAARRPPSPPSAT